MKVLVTGASGFVGSHVARLLAERGDEVFCLVRRSSRVDNLAGLSVQPVFGDLQDSESLERAVQGCEALFHVAADYRLWSRDPRELYHSNVQGTVNLLRAARKAGVRRTVYTSTVGVLGIPRDGSSGTEETPVTLSEMVGHYKRSKFLAEQEVHRFVRQEEMDIVIVNPSTPVGEGDLKPTPTGQVIVDFLNRRMPAYIDTGLNLVDVHDVAAGHLLALERGTTGRRYILGNRNITLQGILQILSEITGMQAPARRIPYGIALVAGAVDTWLFGTLLRRPPHIPLEGVKMAAKHMYFDAARAVEELGLPQSPIEQALERAVQWYRGNGYVHNKDEARLKSGAGAALG
jgi:dihydroflavonol-4-reductase